MFTPDSLTILGCGIPYAFDDASPTSLLVHSGGKNLLVNCGPSIRQDLFSRKISPSQIDEVVILDATLSSISGLEYLARYSPGCRKLYLPVGLEESILHALTGIRMQHKALSEFYQISLYEPITPDKFQSRIIFGNINITPYVRDYEINSGGVIEKIQGVSLMFSLENYRHFKILFSGNVSAITARDYGLYHMADQILHVAAAAGHHTGVMSIKQLEGLEESIRKKMLLYGFKEADRNKFIIDQFAGVLRNGDTCAFSDYL
jgi:ribonuclease BN (tRNA processing enzyme)